MANWGLPFGWVWDLSSRIWALASSEFETEILVNPRALKPEVADSGPMMAIWKFWESVMVLENLSEMMSDSVLRDACKLGIDDGSDDHGIVFLCQPITENWFWAKGDGF